MVDSKRRSSTSFNGQVGKGVVDLPLEIISDILTRLPIESILACKLVCKNWYDLTRDPAFVHLQLSRSPTRFVIDPALSRVANDFYLLLLDAEEPKVKRFPIERKVLKGARIVCSCNGLLLITPDLKLNPVVIYNPITRQRMILPSLLDCKGKLRSHQAGLGFDLSTGRYKVVQEYRKIRSESNRFVILSLGENSWRELSAPPGLLDWDWDGWESLFWNGALYWKMVKTDLQGNCNIGILGFDLSDEKFQIISFPKNFTSPGPAFDLLDLDGRLTLVEHEYDTNMMKLWRLVGNKIGDFSFCLQQTFDTHVRWNDDLFCEVISGLNQNGYLLYVVFKNDESKRSHVTKFFPQMAQYKQLDLPLIPDWFWICRFKPSLICPVAASLLS
ncbi:putative F-box protein At3g16210 isoform X2 [Cornus florida]|nr:putative F-box protein At3g16210 isoform X2 [Cornus florida]XP_059643038.1 putative F-box protein At3g16210 isoform X2 [Cornus florida]